MNAPIKDGGPSDAAVGRAYKRWYAAAQGFREVVADAAHAVIMREAAAFQSSQAAPAVALAMGVKA